MHENAYVASVSLSADVNQTVKAFKEAEAYQGRSWGVLVIFRRFFLRCLVIFEGFSKVF